MDTRKGGLEKGDSVKIWYFFSVSMLKFQGASVFFVLGENPLNLPRGNGQRFAPTSDVSSRLYRDDLVDLLFTKAKVPGFFGWEKHLKFWGIPRDSGPPTVRK